MLSRFTVFIKEWGLILGATLAFVTFFKSVAFASFYIPSESMMPTLEVGDRLFVNKYAYGYSKYSFPLSSFLPSIPSASKRLFYKAPKRGDVVVFRNPKDGVVTIKRLIGLPGDKIEIFRGRVYLNGSEIKRDIRQNYAYKEHEGGVVRVREFDEYLPGGSVHKIIERSDEEYLDNTRLYRVPSGHVFLMGDNRDNSTDSRVLNFLGYVPLENIIGRAEIISFSVYNCQPQAGLRCAKRRYLEKIR